jgi:hypothetical protein
LYVATRTRSPPSPSPFRTRPAPLVRRLLVLRTKCARRTSSLRRTAVGAAPSAGTLTGECRGAHRRSMGGQAVKPPERGQAIRDGEADMRMEQGRRDRRPSYSAGPRRAGRRRRLCRGACARFSGGRRGGAGARLNFQPCLWGLAALIRSRLDLWVLSVDWRGGAGGNRADMPRS